jgi:uncharacterized protein YdeI (YjbR/CyaY-like superfamily)
MKPVLFPTPAQFRAWLECHHARATELWIGFYKKKSGKVAMTYEQAVDEALCFGWIDGIIRRIDDESYMHRFSPRKPKSIWSNVNVGHVARLTAAGRMHAAGLAAFAARDPSKTGVYAFETARPPSLPPALARQFRAERAAWNFFKSQAPSYQRVALHYIVSAKQAATRQRRLARVIAFSAEGKRL